MLDRIYGHSLALLTDLYQLTMAYGYWKERHHSKEAVFHLFYRTPPFSGSYVVSCGQNLVRELLLNLRFDNDDIEYLSNLKGNDGNPLFESGFLQYLNSFRFTGSLDAVAEGEVVFPNEPILRIQAPLIEAQLVETVLLTIINFQSLIATKANRISRAAGSDPVLEFGLRRAQGIDGGLSASRAAYIGGCAATSNVLAGKLFDIPVKGTHAHSWVMSFDSELDAFESYARAMPNNCVFLVDTFDTIRGIKKAVEVGKRLRERGYEMAGIRLDSGDLLKLSRKAREILDDAGFPNAAIVASNDLNEHIIEDLKESGAKIGVWGVGTQLVTAFNQPALGGVYKLAAIRDSEDSPWKNKVKLSDDPIKTSIPGIQQIRRVVNERGQIQKDVIWSEMDGPPTDGGKDLLETMIANGSSTGRLPTTTESRTKCLESVTEIEVRNDEFQVALEPMLEKTRTILIGSQI